MNRFFELNRSVVLLILMALIAVPFFWILYPFWLTIIVGLVFAVSLDPLLNWLERKLKTQSNWALVLLVVGLLILITLPFALVLVKGSQALWLLLQSYTTPESIEKLKAYQADLLQRLEVLKDYGFDPTSFQDTFWTASEKAGTILTAKLGTTLSQIPETILLLLVLILSIISFLMMRRDAVNAVDGTTWISPEGKRKLVSTFSSCCRSVVMSTIVTGAIQATLTTVGAWIFTDYSGLLVFFITFVLSFIPIIGAGPVSLVMSIIAFAQGEVGKGTGLLVFFAVISVADNVIRPWLVAGTTRIPSIWALLCTLGALITLGLPGLLIGPLIGALAVELLPILADEFRS